jgi:methionyl-tRNA formyltransferase
MTVSSTAHRAASVCVVKVLFLGSPESPALAYLREFGEETTALSDALDERQLDAVEPDFAVSHGYRHILKKPLLDRLADRALNLHISYLPWNRGADPNFWSWVDGTPKGVTIHYLDEGIDTGDIIAQRIVEFECGATLASSYALLQDAIVDLFREQWPLIRAGSCDRRPQAPGAGSLHRIADKAAVAHLLAQGWNTPVAALSR